MTWQSKGTYIQTISDPRQLQHMDLNTQDNETHLKPMTRHNGYWEMESLSKTQGLFDLKIRQPDGIKIMRER